MDATLERTQNEAAIQRDRADRAEALLASTQEELAESRALAQSLADQVRILDDAMQRAAVALDRGRTRGIVARAGGGAPVPGL